MSLQYSPSFMLVVTDEPQSLHGELSGDHSLRMSVQSATVIQFTVFKKEKFLDYGISVPLVASRWTLSYHSKKGEWQFKGTAPGEQERTWIPEPEVGKSLSDMISGVFNGEVSGKTASSMLFDLLLQLEVELAGKESWLEEYFPLFFRYYVQKLHRAKVNKVESVMES